ncbi:ABC transporter permease subunit [Hoeflea sp. CAU 1731]
MMQGDRSRLIVILELAPVALVLGGLFGGAVVLAVLQSLGFAPWFGINTFPDFSYFTRLWSGEAFWISLGLTLYYAVASTIVALVLALILSLALMNSFTGRRFVKFVYKLPLVIPYAVGIALAILMLGNGGMLSRLAAFAGWINEPSEFPSILKTHYGWGVIAVYVWKQLPFMTLAVAAVLVGIGRRTQEAALLLGAGPLMIFFRVTLPQIAPGVVTAVLICFSFNIGAFEAPFILGGGYPDTLPVIAWRYFNDADYALQLQGMAAVVSIGLLSGCILLAYLWTYRRFERRIGRN